MNWPNQQMAALKSESWYHPIKKVDALFALALVLILL
jgi:hypothetical protein